MEELIVVLLCVGFNAAFSGVEMAFVSVSRPLLRELARKGNKSAEQVLTLRLKPERTLSVIQVGITLVGAIGAAVGGAGAEELLSPFLQSYFQVSENSSEAMAIIIVVLPITYLSVVIGELVPKSFAMKNPLPIVLHSARWLVLFDKLFGPAVTVLEWSTQFILRYIFRRRPSLITTETVLESTVLLEGLSKQHQQYILNLVNLEKRRVKDILVPWKEVVHVEANQPVEDVEDIIILSGHTRLPVLALGEVTGVLNSKEFISLRASKKSEWDAIIRNVVQLHEGVPLLQALKIMQEQRSHLAVIRSNNQPAGIITMEDIFEEIIGDIFDEDDDGRMRRILSTSSVVKMNRGSDILKD
jgi:putative hemolysin